MRENAYTLALSAVKATQLQKAAAVENMRALAARQHDREHTAIRQGAMPLPKAPRPSLQPKRKIRRRVAAVLAACLVLAAAVAAPLVLRQYLPGTGPLPTTSAPPPDYSHLPMLTVDEDPLAGGGMGFEGYILRDFSEFIIDENLVAAAQQEGAMPVYRNTMPKDRYLMYPEGSGLTVEEMEAKVRAIAEKLGLAVEACEPNYSVANISEDTQIEQLYAVDATVANGQISAFPDGSVRILLENLDGIDVGESPAKHAPREEQETYLKWLLEQYAPLLDYMEQPVPSVWMHRDIYGDPNWTYEVYEGAGTAGERIAAMRIAPATFYVNKQDGVFIVWLRDMQWLEPIGNYPILTVEEARQMLLEGFDEMTTAPEPFPGEEYIVGVDLTYMHSGQMKTILPYYRFYVQLVEDGARLSNESPDWLKTYGAWYVPAVQPEYLEWATPQAPPFNE